MYGSTTIPVGSSVCPGYVARPDQRGRYPIVLVTPPSSGLGPHCKGLARRLARNGIAVVVLGRDASNPTVDDAFAHRSDQVLHYLAGPNVDFADPSRIGLLGIENGGRAAMLSAATRDWPAAAAVVSTPLIGGEPSLTLLARSIRCPFLGLYGANGSVDPSLVDEAQLANPSGQWLLYPGAGDGFFDETTSDYQADSAEDAFARLLSFFAATLDPGVRSAQVSHIS